ncbi:MAG: serine--tRNA ligase [Flavobacteriaceae bacterium]|tara:strand:+ start:2541 stop:3809 length:1269 start_codon:yes stop_codon:yes gene_type:complete
MLKTSFIISNKEEVIKLLSKRGFDANNMVNEIIALDKKRKSIQVQYEETLAEINSISKTIGELFQSGEVSKTKPLKDKSSDLKKLSKDLASGLEDYKAKINSYLLQIPNIPHKDVPAGNDEIDNKIIYESKIDFDKNLREPHWDLAKKYDIIDFELGTKITGSGFPVYKGMGAKLQRALISFFLDNNIDAGYEEVQIPHLVNENSAYGTGQLPDKEGQMYVVSSENLYLIPTAEVPITNIFRDVIISESDLPIMRTGYTPCFRREAGSYGSDVRGLNRLHQFDKVEIVKIEHPKESYNSLQKMKNHIEGIIKKLDLPYRIVTLCGGDLGFTSALTYDFEIFSPAQEKWLEVSSVSNFETFQSNRLKIRYRDNKGNIDLVHTLNGSALALPRVLAAILENNQSHDGIKVPEVLQKYTGFSIIK